MTSSITMNFVGDICFAESVHSFGFGIRSQIKAGADSSLLNPAVAANNGADLSFCNLECVLSNEGENSANIESVDMRGDPQSVGLLKSAGFLYANVANNHIMQHGAAAFSETIFLLNANGITPIGLRGRDGWQCQPVISIIKGKRIGILGYSYQHDRIYNRDLPYASGDDQRIAQDISRLKNQVDLVILTCHWGSEYMNSPSKQIISLAHSFNSIGAKLIVGHHPHVLQGVEEYCEGVIAYSLGNFLFDMTWSTMLRETMILQVKYSSDALQYSSIPLIATKTGALRHLPKRKLLRFIAYMKSLDEKIQAEFLKPDAVANQEYERRVSIELNKNRLLSYLHLFFRLTKYDKRYLFQQIKKTYNSHKEDFLNSRSKNDAAC